MTWKTHISHLNSKIAHALYALKQVKNTLPTTALRTLYFSIIHPHILYGITAWGVATSSTIDKTNKLLKQAIRLIHKAKYNSHTEPLLKKSQILTLQHLHEQQIATFLFDFYKGKLPASFNNTFPLAANIKTRTTRSSNLFHAPTPRKKFTVQLPIFHFPKIANKYNSHILTSKFRSSLKHAIKSQIINNYNTIVNCQNPRCPDCHPNH